MEDYGEIIITGLCIGLFIMFLIGLLCGSPTELENGCIVHNNKVYCEEVED